MKIDLDKKQFKLRKYLRFILLYNYLVLADDRDSLLKNFVFHSNNKCHIKTIILFLD